jgi:uncharacterized membrane protein YcaP (DUF421 family)
MQWWPQNWGVIFALDAPFAELLVRGTIIYLFLFGIMRIIGRRLLGDFNMTDIVVTLLLAVAVRDGITGGYETVGDALVSGAVILGWDLALDRAAYRWQGLRSVLRHGPLPIIRDGELIVENARALLLTRSEVTEKLRGRGVTSYGEVKEAYLEPNGSLSVILRDG